MSTHKEEAIKAVAAAIRRADIESGDRITGSPAELEAEYVINADPLRRRLGEAAVDAIMEGRAAVVPVNHRGYFETQGNDSWGYTASIEMGLDGIRLDNPPAEKETE